MNLKKRKPSPPNIPFDFVPKFWQKYQVFESIETLRTHEYLRKFVVSTLLQIQLNESVVLLPYYTCRLQWYW
jgi:hypothetical protein